MAREQVDSNGPSSQDRLGSLNLERDYRGLKIVQTQALNVFSHFATEASLDHVIRRYVGVECYSRNQSLLDNHSQRLLTVFDSWDGANRYDLFYELVGVDKAEVAAEPSDTFLTGSELGHELFAGGQLDQTVGFSANSYPEFQRDVADYLIHQLCRIYFINPEVRYGTATRRRLASGEAREVALQNLAQSRLARGLIPYSEEDAETLIRLWLAGTPRSDIAATLGRTLSSVQFHKDKFDLPHRRDTRRWTVEEVRDVVALRTERHLSFAQIGEILVRSERSVQHKLIEKGVIAFHRKLWSEEEVKRLSELVTTEYSWTTVLQKLSSDFPIGRSVQEIMARASRADLRLKTEFQIKRPLFEQLIAEGLSDKVMADRLGIARATVGKWRKRLQAEKEAK